MASSSFGAARVLSKDGWRSANRGEEMAFYNFTHTGTRTTGDHTIQVSEWYGQGNPQTYMVRFQNKRWAEIEAMSNAAQVFSSRQKMWRPATFLEEKAFFNYTTKRKYKTGDHSIKVGERFGQGIMIRFKNESWARIREAVASRKPLPAPRSSSTHHRGKHGGRGAGGSAKKFSVHRDYATTRK
jgi:hypothetical protein